MNRLKTKLPLMKLGEKENALDALWANNHVTSGFKTKQIVDKNKIKMTLKAKRINGKNEIK
jgi:hypothetical protein